MEEIDFITEGGEPFEKTLNLQNVLGKKVISKNGFLVGRVAEVRMDENGLDAEGVLIRRGLFKKRVYINKKYLNRLTNDSVLLTIDPFLLIKGLKVVTAEGEVIGRVKDFVRKNSSNNLDALIVYSFMRGKFNVNYSDVKSIGYSIILKQNYEPPKKYLWKKSE